MNRYLVFAWINYQASGGINDLDSAHNDLSYVLIRCEELKKFSYMNIQVYDCKTSQEVYRWSKNDND